jgi:hypothetical protein
VDVYFFRRCGIVFARAARAVRLSPNGVSILAAIAGGAGGAMLASESLALTGVGCLFLHGILDSADGQLARMTGRTSELGRLLDGVAGYVTHAAAYLGIAAGSISRGGSWSILGWAVIAGLFTAIQAQMYDYHRTAYASIVVHGTPTRRAADSGIDGEVASPRPAPSRLMALYEAVQRRLAGLHPEVERRLASRATAGRVRDEDRAEYRAAFCRPVVRGWNLLGDNVRRYAFAVLAFTHRLDWMFGFILVPMNMVLMVIWLWQRRVDREYLLRTR